MSDYDETVSNTDGLPTDAALDVRDIAAKVSRSYKCPNCDGEFDEWRESFSGEHRCPFCDLPEGTYNPPDARSEG